jgi:hypothetical protein
MTYGQWLKRTEMGMTVKMSTEANGKGPAMDLDMQALAVAQFEFATCVADHNLTDAEDNPLDFRHAWVVDLLDPVVGQEIGAAIDKLNQFQEELGNLPAPSVTS